MPKCNSGVTMTEPSTQQDADPTVEAMDLSEIREIVDNDKSLAVEVAQEAKSQVNSFRLTELRPDITGKPDGVNQFNRFKRDQLRNLQAVTRSPFFARYRAVMTMKGESEEIDVLLTKARDVAGAVMGDGWLLTTWTSPLGLAIRGVQPGGQAEIEVRWVTTYEVNNSSLYETLLPEVANATFDAIGRRGVIASEDELSEVEAKPQASTELAPVEYEAKPAFGLSDIVVLVDEPQRAALALPFGQSVMIDGPPGSGKTSVGIMRTAVLYDQQWDELDLDRQSDKPFHDYGTMRILVYNEEMVEYLQSLAQSIGVSHVQVMTTKDFFKRICRETRMLTGTERRDRPSLAVLKSRREALRAYFAGFQAHAAAYWRAHEEALRNGLGELGVDFLTLADRLNDWIGRISEARVAGDHIEGTIGVADGLTEAVFMIERGRSPTRRAASRADDSPQLDSETIGERMPEARKLIEEAVRGVCGRAGITKAMFEQPEYAALLEKLAADGVQGRVIEDGDRLWRRQYRGELPAYSELDLAMSAWLGARLLLSINTRRKPWIGGKLERLTHLVIDEAQDLSPSHLAVLASQLVRDGTMTLVGDIHQNLNPDAGLRAWEDAGLSDLMMTAFGVNHRQTKQLGDFMQGLHSGLFGQECSWEPSPKTTGPQPRVGIGKSWTQLTNAIASEARFWRERIADATIAVLVDGKMKPKQMRELQQRLEVALSDLLVTVEAVLPGTGGEPLRRTDRVVIASVTQTKGLEFDAVIFVEPRPRWAGPVDEIDLRVRNGFYVATSRARAGLSICMSNLPACIDPLVDQGLCERVEWVEENSV